MPSDHPGDRGVVTAPTITELPECASAVLVTGSHGGRYPGALAARAGVRAVIFNDAGVGLQQAGIAALPLLDTVGIAAATVSHNTSRIGDPDDMLTRGVISHANHAARRLGVVRGLSARTAAEVMTEARGATGSIAQEPDARHVLQCTGGRRPLVLVDSASQVDPRCDAEAVVVTGSHGGLIGGDATKALRAACYGAVFNDAGIGIDGAGTSRLAALEQRGIAAITVAAISARIGDAASSLGGVVSAANPLAIRRGAQIGQPAQISIFRWVYEPSPSTRLGADDR